MAEKIFAMHDVSHRGYVAPGDIIQVDVDWILASELSWAVSEHILLFRGTTDIDVRAWKKYTPRSAVQEYSETIGFG